MITTDRQRRHLLIIKRKASHLTEFVRLATMITCAYHVRRCENRNRSTTITTTAGLKRTGGRGGSNNNKHNAFET